MATQTTKLTKTQITQAIQNYACTVLGIDPNTPSDNALRMARDEAITITATQAAEQVIAFMMECCAANPNFGSFKINSLTIARNQWPFRTAS